MNGDKFNKSKKAESGQVLLLLVMVMGTLLIVAMTAIFQSSSQTQISGINQTAQKTLAAAEAGLEVGLVSTGSGTFAELGINNLQDIDLNASAVQIAELREPDYVTPRVEEDQQYTFYLSEYPDLDSPYGGQFYVTYQSQNEAQDCTDIALEFTFIYDVGDDGTYEIAKRIADAGDNITVSGTALTDIYQAPPSGELVNDVEFNCRTSTIDTGDFENIKVMLVTTYLKATRLGFVSLTGNFPPQGKTITSTARATSGLTRVAEIFQSYPQLSAELFMTSF